MMTATAAAGIAMDGHGKAHDDCNCDGNGDSASDGDGEGDLCDSDDAFLSVSGRYLQCTAFVVMVVCTFSVLAAWVGAASVCPPPRCYIAPRRLVAGPCPPRAH